MTQDPRLRASLAQATPSLDTHPAEPQSSREPSQVTEVARTLAAHGGGALSVDLAFDLVLHEVVEQARITSGATGAAIALFRDGELVCRATSGENAPDLGVRVETASSLAGSCVTTGEIQQCRDTETDPRVNAGACQKLGVRSMLIAPLVDAEKIFGILQVFSSRPDAFGKREMTALQVLAGRVAESNREAQAGRKIVDTEATSTIEPTQRVHARPASDAEVPAAPRFEVDLGPRRSEIWSSILALLVIAVAILLGVAIGWHGAVKGSGAPQSKPPIPVGTINPTPDAATKTGVEDSTVASVATSRAVEVAPPGGLLVTQNGKVVYRSPAAKPVSAPKKPTDPIHRVEPEYPAEARAQHIQGSVVLDVQVLANGSVGNIAVVSGPPLLADAALQAVKQWRYQPSVIDGRAVESQTRITIKFTLPPA